MYNISHIAESTIPKPGGVRNILFPNGGTMDIVATILFADKLSAPYTKEFSKSLKGLPVRTAAKIVYDMVMKDINYLLDPIGMQDVKSPSQTFWDGYGDCKSISVLIISVFKNLGFKSGYRFVSYTDRPTWKHVYAVVYDENGKVIIVDPVYEMEVPHKGGFNIEKPYKFKKDYMTQISYIAGTSPERRKRFIAGSPESVLKLTKPVDQISEAELDLMIRQQQVAIQKDIIDRARGIGNIKSEKFQDEADVIGDVLDVISDDTLNVNEKIEELGMIEEDADSGEYNTSDEIMGIGSAEVGRSKRKQKKAARKAKRTVKKAAKKQKRVEKKAAKPAKKAVRKEKRKKFFKKVGEKVKKGLKAVTKVATAPMRAAAKGVIEVALPKIAPMFLYLFVPDSAVTSLPPQAQKKRIKNLKFKKFIVDKIGMKDQHFMGILRNGITKRYSSSPEAVINKMMGKQIAGIGDIGLVSDMVKVAVELIKKLVKVFGKKDGEEMDISEDDVPDNSDFEGMTSKEKSTLNRETRKKNQHPTELDEAEGNGQRESETYGDEESKSNGGGRRGIC